MRLDLDGLADASREALMSEWREVVGRPPPKHLSRPLMVQMSSPQIMYHFLIEFLELVVSCLGLGEGGCDCTA